MKQVKALLRAILPKFLRNKYGIYKKKKVNQKLELQKAQGKIWTKEDLIGDFKKAGIQIGDTLLVHCSLSKIGYVEDGAKTVVEALLETLGEKGNLMMPSSPNESFQLDYIRKYPVFDVKNTPSKLGSVSEYFRKLPDTKRSLHPLEPVCALGPNAEWLTEGHFGELTAYTANSPFARMYELKGKILYLGVTLDNAGTNLHTLEDVVQFKYPVYFPEIFNAEIIDKNGNHHQVKTKVHNPIFSKKRKCDELIPMFIHENVAIKCKIGEADSYLFDGKKMFDCMIRNYNENGITMYTPEGSEN